MDILSHVDIIIWDDLDVFMGLYDDVRMCRYNYESM